MLGYADTDLVTLFLPLLIGLAPAVWVMHFLRHPLALPFHWFQRWTKRPIPIALDAPGHQPYAPISAFWVFALSASGLLAWWSQEWHSMFPYIVRYNVALIGCMALLLARPGERRTALLAGLAYALPALGGPTGAMFPLTLLIAIMGRERQFVAQLHRPAVLAAFWLMAAALLVDLSVLSTMLHHVQGYLKRAGDAVATGTPDPLVFPSVAQSIIEIQDLTRADPARGLAGLRPRGRPGEDHPQGVLPRLPHIDRAHPPCAELPGNHDRALELTRMAPFRNHGVPSRHVRHRARASAGLAPDPHA